MQPYSPERRTALIFCGTGAHGVYHAGVLRALQEAGVKVDLMAGHGVGASAAALGAIDGAARLWDADGLWKAGPTAFYRWRWPIRAAGWLVVATGLCLLIPLILLAAGFNYAVVFLGIAAATAAAALVLLGAGAAIEQRHGTVTRRRAAGRPWWRLLGAPLDVETIRGCVGAAIWQLVRGADPQDHPDARTLGRRYADVLAENLGQPGFRELIVLAADLDARRDVVAALLRDPFRRELVTSRPDLDRRADLLDLTGVGRDHAFDVIAAGLIPPLGCEPQMTTFSPDSYWRGETHRLCYRPGAISRLLEEVAAAGVSQAVIVSAVAAVPAPHRLTVPRLDARHRLGEFLAASESAALRDALEMARLRFDSVYLISPAHNPIGPFDFAGAYDDASDRRQELLEQMERAYEDAYRQFIEPIVGASGEHLARAAPEAAEERYSGILDDQDLN